MNAIKIVIFVILSALLTACAGTNFVRPADNTFKLGKSTKQEVINAMGKPMVTSQALKNDVPVETIAYNYAAGAQSLVGGVTPARSTAFSFANGILVGQIFSSSFAEDKTDFDETKVSDIRKGKTTKDEVIKLLGRPSGHIIYPLIAPKDGTGLVYQYNQTKGTAFTLKLYAASLVVTVGKDNVVTDVTLEKTGEK